MIPIALAAALLHLIAHPSSLTVADMRWRKRVLLLAAPRVGDPGIAGQRRALAGWDRDARERDLAIVTIVGDRVEGAADTAAALRRRFGVPTDRFVAILIGKDGGAKMRRTQPIAAQELAETIDAMPMRRAGQR